MDRQGAGEVFFGFAMSQGGARMRWPAGVAGAAGGNSGKTARRQGDGATRGRPATPEDCFASACRMRCAQRRATGVMLSYMWRKARLRAHQAKEFLASPMGKERACPGSRPQRRKACRAITQRRRASQPACQAVIQTIPSTVGGLWRGQKRRTASARMPSAMCSLRQAATSQMSHKGVRVLPFMAGSIAPQKGVGKTSVKSPGCFSSEP
jgi:hypothetical protein